MDRYVCNCNILPVLQYTIELQSSTLVHTVECWWLLLLPLRVCTTAAAIACLVGWLVGWFTVSVLCDEHRSASNHSCPAVDYTTGAT